MIPYREIFSLHSLSIGPYTIVLILKYVEFCCLKDGTFSFKKQIIALRKPLLIVSILAQIIISTYFNYYSFSIINNELLFFILFTLLSAIICIILILVISFFSFKLNRKKINQPKPATDENVEFIGNKESYKYSNSDTPNYKWKNVITIL